MGRVESLWRVSGVVKVGDQSTAAVYNHAGCALPNSRGCHTDHNCTGNLESEHPCNLSKQFRVRTALY